MPRPNKPWRRKSAGGAWYGKVDGKQVRLAPAEAARSEADKVLRALLVDRDRGKRPRAGSPPLGELIDLFLEDCDARVSRGELEPITRDGYQRRLKSLTAHPAAEIQVDRLRPKDVMAWVDSRDWGPTSRHDGIAAVKAVLRWAARMGHVDSDPLAGMRKPQRAERRELVMDASVWPAVREAILSPEFRDLADFLYQTGARPGEAFRIEAGHIDWARARATLRGKTTRKTGRLRTIHLNGAAMTICRRLATQRPEGPIFRNGKGNPWTKDAVNCQVRGIRRRSGLGREVIAYALRHVFATDALEQDIPLASVAELLGHSDTRVLSRVYSHLADREDHLKGKLAKVRPHNASEGSPASRDGDATT